MAKMHYNVVILQTFFLFFLFLLPTKMSLALYKFVVETKFSPTYIDRLLFFTVCVCVLCVRACERAHGRVCTCVRETWAGGGGGGGGGEEGRESTL